MKGGCNMIKTKRRASHIRQTRADRIFQAVIVALGVVLMILVAYPLYFTVIASFSKPEDVLMGRVILWPRNISFESYKMVVAERDIWMGYGNTILYTVLGTAVNMVLTTMMAYPLSCRETPWRAPLTFVASFTMLFSGGLIPTYLLVRQLGLYDTIWAMILPTGITTYNMLVMKSFFQSSIPIELKEAAHLDGCNDLRTLLLVVLPLSGPILAVMVLFYTVAHWNEYFNALIYLRNRSLMPLQVILREILLQNQELAAGDGTGLYERMMAAETMKYAIIIIASVPVICLYPLVQRHFVKGVMVGAIKG